jgi:acyl carrier protein
MIEAQKRSAPDIAHWLVAEIAKLAGIPRGQIREDEPITSYLFDSRDALSLAAELEAWLGVELSASIVWDHPTIAALAEHVAVELLRSPRGADAPPPA